MAGWSSTCLAVKLAEWMVVAGCRAARRIPALALRTAGGPEQAARPHGFQHQPSWNSQQQCQQLLSDFDFSYGHPWIGLLGLVVVVVVASRVDQFESVLFERVSASLRQKAGSEAWQQPCRRRITIAAET